jgi:hypothetical protein
MGDFVGDFIGQTSAAIRHCETGLGLGGPLPRKDWREPQGALQIPRLRSG